MAMTAARGESDPVAEILANHWRICEPAVRTELGVSRITWRVGQRYWLSQSESRRSAALLRRAQLLQRLHGFLKDEHLSISVPEIVASESGHLIVADGGYGWCLTRHLQGFHPDSSDPGIYPVLAEGLARFHRELRLFSERQKADAPHGICVMARQNIARLDPASFVPFTKHPREQELVMRAGEWLLPRLARFEILPRQLVHGDWTPRNVFFQSSDCGAHLTAVLDFEAMAYDPVHVDLANTCSTLLMWSRLDRIAERIGDVLSTYERFGGIRLEHGDIYTAMLAHWFCHYWSWRDRLEDGGFGLDVKERLCLRIERVLDYLNEAAAGSV
jgi:Ser/Thr protein kinase RdoA (MazF antagonist)